jgi:hypothetical protein
MRRIGLAALFLLASVFGALAADMGAQGTGKQAQPMHHKTMHYRHHGKTAYYRHGRYRTGYYVGGRRHYGNYALYGTPGYRYYHGRRVYGSRHYGHRRTAAYRTHHGRQTAMTHKKGHRTAMVHKSSGTAKTQTQPAGAKTAKTKKPSGY